MLRTVKAVLGNRRNSAGLGVRKTLVSAVKIFWPLHASSRNLIPRAVMR